ncbi:hypothetical protein GMES_3939 [Paraglaciecola mesophila KMM 241]|uniref:Uncharacterized protein n=1 Tax=Paraglaciecola mesophila KMM 241 TaxID=1128912 RepID=K6Z754_9ALTE|nr:hypothetical protein GMES_3939 [Paraglaciecola mesophila KMM 241]
MPNKANVTAIGGVGLFCLKVTLAIKALGCHNGELLTPYSC